MGGEPKVVGWASEKSVPESAAGVGSLTDVPGQEVLPTRSMRRVQYVGTSTKSAVKPRFQLKEEDKSVEKDRHLKRVLGMQINFADKSKDISVASIEDCDSVAEVLKEYMEWEILVQGHLGRGELTGEKDEVVQDLCVARAEACIKRIKKEAEVVYMRPTSLGRQNDMKCGCVTFLALTSPDASPQERINLIMKRVNWGFPLTKPVVTPKGRRNAATIARVLEETPHHRVTLYVPRSSSDLAIKRGEKVVEAIRETGIAVQVVLHTAGTKEPHFGVIYIEEHQPELEPQAALYEILRQTPMAFQPKTSELAELSKEALTACVKVLNRTKDKVCVVQAWSGKGGQDPTVAARLHGMLLQRAQQIVDHLKAQGAKIPVKAEGHVGAPETQEVKKPCILISLYDLEEVREASASTEHQKGHFPFCL